MAVFLAGAREYRNLKEILILISNMLKVNEETKLLCAN